MKLRIRKMKKFWILTAVLIAAMLLLVPAIAFAEDDDSATADNSFGSTEFSVSGSFGSEAPSGSNDSTPGLPSTNYEAPSSYNDGSPETFSAPQDDFSGVDGLSDNNMPETDLDDPLILENGSAETSGA